MRSAHVLVSLILVSPVAPAWVALFDQGAEDEGRALVLSPDGLLSYTAGYATGDGGFWDREAALVAHRVADGSVAWSRTVGASSGPFEFWGVAADATRVVAVGTAHDAGTTNPFRLDLLAVAFDAATGATLWTAVLDLGTFTRANAVALSPDAAFVVGADDLGEGRSRAVVHALDLATGTARWTRTVGTFGTNDARDVAFDASTGTVFVAGTAYTGASPVTDMLLLALDPATGEDRWTARFDGAAGGYDTGAALAVREGLVALVGTTEGTLDAWGDLTTAAYDASTGALLWSASHAGLGRHYDGANDVAIAAGKVFVAGSTHALPNSPTQPLVLAYDAADGAQLWSALEGGLLLAAPGEGLAIAASADGASVYMAGRHRPDGGSTDALVVAYDGGSGLARWRGTHTSAPGIYDTAHDLALTPDGARVLVAGLAGAGEVSILGSTGAEPAGAAGEPHGDVLTLAYDA